MWRSVHPSPIGLTVLTASTTSRLDALEAQCASWEGPLSAAVYVGLPAWEGEPRLPTLTTELPKPMASLLDEASSRVEGLFRK